MRSTERFQGESHEQVCLLERSFCQEWGGRLGGDRLEPRSPMRGPLDNPRGREEGSSWDGGDSAIGKGPEGQRRGFLRVRFHTTLPSTAPSCSWGRRMKPGTGPGSGSRFHLNLRWEPPMNCYPLPKSTSQTRHSSFACSGNASSRLGRAQSQEGEGGHSSGRLLSRTKRGVSGITMGTGVTGSH